MLKELIKLFIRTNGRNPNNLELLQLKFKAAQQSGKGQILTPDFGKNKPWYKVEGELTHKDKIDWLVKNVDPKAEQTIPPKATLEAMLKDNRGDLIDHFFEMHTKKLGGKPQINIDTSDLKHPELVKKMMTDKKLKPTLVKTKGIADKEFESIRRGHILNLAKNSREFNEDLADRIIKREIYTNVSDAQRKLLLNDLDQVLKEPLAGGGIAGMLGEPTYADENHRVPFKGGKKVLEGLTKLFDEFFPGTTKIGKRSKPYPEKVQEKMDLRKAFENFNNKIATQEALSKGSKKMRGPIENVNKKPYDMQPSSTDHTTWLQQGKFFNPKALDMYGKKVPANWIEVEKKAAQKLIDDLGPLDVSPNHPNYKDMKAIRQSAKDRLASIKITEALGGNIQMHDWIRMNRKNIDIDDYIKKPGAKKVVDELSGIKKIMIKDKESGKLYEKGSEIDKSIQLEKKAEKMLSKMSDAEIELRSEFPGISDDLIKNILADDNPQRIAEVKAAMKEAMKMQEKGMGVEEIINIFKKKPTKHASGGLAGMLGE